MYEFLLSGTVSVGFHDHVLKDGASWRPCSHGKFSSDAFSPDLYMRCTGTQTIAVTQATKQTAAVAALNYTKRIQRLSEDKYAVASLLPCSMLGYCFPKRGALLVSIQ
jgi:hypothetical protein